MKTPIRKNALWRLGSEVMTFDSEKKIALFHTGHLIIWPLNEEEFLLTTLVTD